MKQVDSCSPAFSHIYMEKNTKENMEILLIARVKYGKMKQLNNYRYDKC